LVAPIVPGRAGSGERSVWPVVAVVVDKDTEHSLEMAAVENEQPVEAFRSGGADEAFGDRVCLRRSDRRADDLDPLALEHVVEIAGELAVAIMDEETKGSRSLAEPPRRPLSLAFRLRTRATR
jgi:hypothetical protein